MFKYVQTMNFATAMLIFPFGVSISTNVRPPTTTTTTTTTTTVFPTPNTSNGFPSFEMSSSTEKDSSSTLSDNSSTSYKPFPSPNNFSSPLPPPSSSSLSSYSPLSPLSFMNISSSTTTSSPSPLPDVNSSTPSLPSTSSSPPDNCTTLSPSTLSLSPNNSSTSSSSSSSSSPSSVSSTTPYTESSSASSPSSSSSQLPDNSTSSPISTTNPTTPTPIPGSHRGFKIYWNVPSDRCKKHNIHFEPLTKMYGIIANKNDSFRGENVSILYDPGEFPIIQKFPNNTVKYHNGGFPQNGSLEKHLEKLKADIEKFVYKNFSGLGIIDFEVWRPVFRQNWNDQVIYRNKSFEWAKELKNNCSIAEGKINATAKETFEAHAKKFMLETLKEVKKLRPEGKWGYYGFPYCYNYRVNDTPECPKIAVKENNETLWLFNESTALYPSIYIKTKYNETEHVKFMIGKLNEAYRVSAMANYVPVYPYVWFRYLDNDTYLTEADMFYSIDIPRHYQMGGIILWGKGSDLDSKDKCQKFFQYMNETLGPALNRSLSYGNRLNHTILQ
ncbi:Hyalurononglucosaminidase precursor, putative [Pediculus humanus corporis]|uniref:Hyaluronidase n=1 Tax=Pediculus humanus subsp. corporis TaxID=121224 RepID=E0VLE9_PEDHC|nr:Hyalurononglucosaminidase precursor, putative [Pediculus humanus corporis]EEB14205.1 Hyalurononglucosaminidase precursor, putative [Pediculus humanus corporis]